MGSGLMWNDTDFCGGRMSLNMFVRDLSERWNSLDIKYAVMFTVTLM